MVYLGFKFFSPSNELVSTYIFPELLLEVKVIKSVGKVSFSFIQTISPTIRLDHNYSINFAVSKL